MKGPHDKYTTCFQDVLEPLYIEVACLTRHYAHHLELEMAASMYHSMKLHKG